jgi:hypothetical protein
MADIDRTGGMMVVLFIALAAIKFFGPGNHLLALRLTVLDSVPDMQVTSFQPLSRVGLTPANHRFLFEARWMSSFRRSSARQKKVG